MRVRAVAECGAAPMGLTMWRVHDPATGSSTHVQARLWFDARAAGAVRLGANPMGLQVVPCPECESPNGGPVGAR